MASVRGISHENCTAAASQTNLRVVVCNRCGKTPLVWHRRCAVIGTDNHALYEGEKFGYRNWRADTTKPHVCSGKYDVSALLEQKAPAAPAAAAPAPVDDDHIRNLISDEVGEMVAQAMSSSAQELVASEATKLRKNFDALVDTTSKALVADLDTLHKSIDTRLSALALPPKPTVIELRSQDGTVQRIEGTHRQMPELLYWIGARDMNGHRFPVMLFGKPGVSKSHTTHQAATALGLSFGLISLNPQTPESRLFGFYHANGGYIRTAFREAFEHGGVFLIDEIDNASDSLLTSLNSCLANGHGSFPDGLVTRHENFVCVATANTPGRGGDANHAGRRQLDAATINRFACIEWQNDDELELALVEKVNPNGRLWLEWVRRVRVHCAQHHPRVVVSPRSSIMGAKACLDSPFSLETIADMVLFKGLDKDTRSKILGACPLPAAKEIR